MLKKSNFFKNFSYKSVKFSKNLLKAKKIFKSFQSDLKNHEIPLMNSYNKSYIFNFTKSITRNFSKYDNIVIIGMGGSILGTKSIYSFFKTKIKKNVIFLDNLDCNLYSEFNKIKNLKNYCVIVVSKSGNTLETAANFSIIFSKKILKKKLIFITEIKDSCLINIANKYDAEIIEHNQDIGGRYSVLSEVGMLPAVLMGLNVKKFRNLEKLINNKKYIETLIYNVANIYTLNQQGFKSSVILNYSSNLNDLCFWYQQLIGESLGKRGKGITPIVSQAPKDHHSVLQLYLDGPRDKFFTFLSSAEKKNKYKTPRNFYSNNMNYLNNKSLKVIIKAQSKAVMNVFSKKNIPFREIYFNKNNEEELGSIFTFFVLETILLARMMNINPLDQPAVEDVKIITKKILSR